MHSEKACSNVEEEDQERSMGWGKYMSATPYRRLQRSIKEVENVKASRKVLFIAKPTKLVKDDFEVESM